jgi:chromosome segregation ATPase
MAGHPSPTERTPAAWGWPRVLGLTLIATGVLGILLSIAGLIAVAMVGPSIEAGLLRELDTLDRALVITSDGLAVTETALADAETLIKGISSTVSQATTAITTTQPTLRTIEELTGTSLPETINNTRQALDAAQETARIVDGVLGTLAIFGVSYNPEVPLNVAISNVSTSLAEIPADLEEVSAGIGAANKQVSVVADDLSEVAASLEALGAQIGEAAGVIQQYQALAGDLRAEVSAIKEAAPGWIMAARVGLTLLLIWMGLAQIGLITQGGERLRRDGADIIQTG